MGELKGLTFLLDVDEFFRDATPTNIEEEVRKKVILSEDKWRYSNQILLDVGYTQAEIDSVEACEPSWHREARDRNYLKDKIFGAEGN